MDAMLKWRKIGVFLGVLALGILANGSPAKAEVMHVLHLDSGFIGHPVNLDILEGQAFIKWDNGELAYPTDLYVSTSSSEIEVVWETSYALTEKGVQIGVKKDYLDFSHDDAWSDVVLETKTPFGAWRRADVEEKDGFIITRVGPEVRVRLALAPRGMRSGEATWYRHKGGLFAASPDFPKGTKLKVSLEDDPTKSVVVTVNDYGPDRDLFPNRVIDLDSVAFKKLSPLSAGKLKVLVEPLPLPIPVKDGKSG
ncbi:MAG: septal ring lytic transglycosylase RlpA family protein [Patescibacteria group bacterium]|nr:septal ring lytic transglycosylase RlpA family protein [Patescibacteria group bacterium]